jgi:hypothetical protein
MSNPSADLAHQYLQYNPRLVKTCLLCDLRPCVVFPLDETFEFIWEGNEILSGVGMVPRKRGIFIVVLVGVFVVRGAMCHWAQGVVLCIRWVPLV